MSTNKCQSLLLLHDKVYLKLLSLQVLLGPKHDASTVPVAVIYCTLHILEQQYNPYQCYENVFEFVQVMCNILWASFFRIYSVYYYYFLNAQWCEMPKG